MSLEHRLRRLEQAHPADGRPEIRRVEILIRRQPGDPPAGRYPEPGTPTGAGLPIFRVYFDAPEDTNNKRKEP